MRNWKELLMFCPVHIWFGKQVKFNFFPLLEMSSWSRTQNVYTPGSGKSTSPAPAALTPKRDLPHVHYNVPVRADTAVLMVFFNPAQSFRIIQNLLYIKQKLEAAHIPYFIGELAYNDAVHMLTPADNVFQMRGTSYMFSKENIAQTMLLQTAVARYSKYVLLDCDVVFEDPTWIDSISTALDTHDVGQPFTYVNQLDIKFKSDVVKTSIVKDNRDGHTGYAWAFRRDWWERAGLYEYALIGGGDKCLAHMAGVELAWLPKPYLADVPPRIETRVNYLDGTIWHLPHGSLEKRKYVERAATLSDAMRSLRIARLRDAVERNHDGIFEWKSQYKATMNALLLNYFKSREDDG